MAGITMAAPDLSKIASLPAMFAARVDACGEAILFRKRYGTELRTCTWNEAFDKVMRIASGLVRMGFQRGDRAAVMAENGIQLALCDLAVQAAGGVVVPIYTTLATGEIRHILENSDCSIFFAGKKAALPQVQEALEGMDTPPMLVALREVENEKDLDAQSLSAMIETKPVQEELDELETRIARLQREDLSSIIYTSGTTGPSKGVMLTHGNIIANVECALEAVPLEERDTTLSFLPMSHSFERTLGYFAMIAAGATIHYARSLATVAQDFAEASPTVALVVPRFMEKLYQRAKGAVNDAKPLQRFMAKTALHIRTQRARKIRRNERVPFWITLLSRPAETVLKKIRDRLGGRLRFLASGGAAMNVEVWDFFEAVGITVLQGYGLTETAPVVAVNRLERNKPESVGPPIRDVSVRIADDGEIEVAGPNIMKGYWKNPEETAKVFTGDGWFRTGDIGRVDGDGYLYITDRKKDIIVSASGKNISPQNIENALCLDPLIEFACVLGEGRNSLGALLSPNSEALAMCAREMGILEDDPEALAQDSRVIDVFKEVIARVNRSLAPYERINRFRLAERPFSQEGGELTPTMKVRRKIIQELHADEIRKLFSPLDEPAAH
jgi:long-chain acyl-CoA synthetase